MTVIPNWNFEAKNRSRKVYMKLLPDEFYGATADILDGAELLEAQEWIKAGIKYVRIFENNYKVYNAMLKTLEGLSPDLQSKITIRHQDIFTVDWVDKNSISNRSILSLDGYLGTSRDDHFRIKNLIFRRHHKSSNIDEYIYCTTFNKNVRSGKSSETREEYKEYAPKIWTEAERLARKKFGVSDFEKAYLDSNNKDHDLVCSCLLLSQITSEARVTNVAFFSYRGINQLMKSCIFRVNGTQSNFNEMEKIEFLNLEGLEPGQTKKVKGYKDICVNPRYFNITNNIAISLETPITKRVQRNAEAKKINKINVVNQEQKYFSAKDECPDNKIISATFVAKRGRCNKCNRSLNKDGSHRADRGTYTF